MADPPLISAAACVPSQPPGRDPKPRGFPGDIPGFGQRPRRPSREAFQASIASARESFLASKQSFGCQADSRRISRAFENENQKPLAVKKCGASPRKAPGAVRPGFEGTPEDLVGVLPAKVSHLHGACVMWGDAVENVEFAGQSEDCAANARKQRRGALDHGAWVNEKLDGYIEKTPESGQSKECIFNARRMKRGVLMGGGLVNELLDPPDVYTIGVSSEVLETARRQQRGVMKSIMVDDYLSAAAKAADSHPKTATQLKTPRLPKIEKGGIGVGGCPRSSSVRRCSPRDSSSLKSQAWRLGVAAERGSVR